MNKEIINLEKMLIVGFNPYLKILLDDMKDDESLKTFFQYKEEKNVKIVMYEGKIIGLTSTIFNGRIPELQAAIFKKYQKQGFGTALLNKLTKIYFEENYPMVILKIDKNNLNAINQVSKTGFLRDNNEEINPNNKEGKFYTFYKINYNYKKELLGR